MKIFETCFHPQRYQCLAAFCQPLSRSIQESEGLAEEISEQLFPDVLSLWLLSPHGSVEVRVGALRPSSSFTKSNLRLDFNLLQETFQQRTSLSEQVLCVTPFITHSLPQPAFQFHLLWISDLSQLNWKVIWRQSEAVYLFCIPWESWEDRKQNLGGIFSKKSTKKAEWITDSVTRPKAERFICVTIAFFWSSQADKHRDKVTDTPLACDQSSDHLIVSWAASP